MAASLTRAATGGSLQRKLSLTLLVTIVCVFPPIILGVDGAARDAVEQELKERHRAVLDLNAAALAQPLADGDAVSLARLAAVMAGSHEVDGVQISDRSGQELARSAHFDAYADRPAGSTISSTMVTREDGAQLGLLRIQFNTHRASEAMSAFYWRFGLALAIGLGLLFGALMLAMRGAMLRPLAVLMEAIDRSQRGERRLAEWRSKDELGRLVAHFNAMQVKLTEEEAKLRTVNAHLSALYNKTPAMLFSVDRAGRIADVSDYWLEMTGYARAEAVGQPLERFLDNPAGGAAARPARREGFEQWSGRFIKRSGELMDVYLSCAAEPLQIGRDEARSLLVMVDVTSLKRAEAELLRQARLDGLTGLPNRRRFKERLEEELKIVAREGERIEIGFIDLDRFKSVNDHLGHHAGDMILEHCGRRIAETLPTGALLARLGGDEFAVLQRSVAGETLDHTAERINAALKEPFSVCGSAVTLSASIGIAAHPENGATAGDLMRAADLAMYRSKQAGRSGVSSYDSSIGDEAKRLFEVELMMQSRAPEDRFYLDYQPIIRLETGAVAGAEALLRMRDDQGGVVSPGAFIPIAEETGLMPKLGAFALARGLEQFRAFARRGDGGALRLAVNLSPAQVTMALPDQVAATLEAADFPADHLVLEITESVFLKNDASLREIFDRLRAQGCRLALDDFGTGYSSLSYLNDFPVDIVKIDRQFIRRLDGDGGAAPDPELQARARSLLQGVAAIAEALHLSAVAEGVETEAQRRLVREMGFEYGQGFLWSRPVNIESFEERLTAETPATLAR